LNKFFHFDSMPFDAISLQANLPASPLISLTYLENTPHINQNKFEKNRKKIEKIKSIRKGSGKRFLEIEKKARASRDENMKFFGL
jgi:hypothetical protein